MYCLLSEAQALPSFSYQREGNDGGFAITTMPSMPAQRQAEVLGTPVHAQLTCTIKSTYTMHLLRH